MGIHDVIIRIENPEGALPGGRSSLTTSEKDLLSTLRDGASIGELIRGASDPHAAVRLIDDLIELEDMGLLRLDWPAASPSLARFFAPNADPTALCRQSPGLWNIFAYEKEWDAYPEYNDFLHPDSQMYYTKRFETGIYLELLTPFLGRLEPGKVLDAAGGIGRFAVELLRRSHHVTLADASPRALKCAWRYLAEIGGRFDLELMDIEDLSAFSDASFDAVLAIEAVCYATHPEKALAEILRVARPGALIVLSVENQFGALIADANLYADNVVELLRGNRVCVEEYVCTTYYTRESFGKLLENAGFRPKIIEGCHFTAEGILGRIVDEKLLADDVFCDSMRGVERLCRENPALRELPRAWLAIGYK